MSSCQRSCRCGTFVTAGVNVFGGHSAMLACHMQQEALYEQPQDELQVGVTYVRTPCCMQRSMLHAASYILSSIWTKR